MNILFVNYGDFTSNSLNHIAGFANALIRCGHACIVAVPERKSSISAISNPLFTAALFDELLKIPNVFSDGQGADIIHAWTPREEVRKFVVAYQAIATNAARVIIHLEDNEHQLLESFTGVPFAEFRAQPPQKIIETLIDGLPHPLRHEAFLLAADGITYIIDTLREFAPAGIPSTLLPPGVDFSLYFPQPPPPELRSELGIAHNEKVIAYTGSVTFANQTEVRSLYAAAALLNERGVPTRLIRTGITPPDFSDSLSVEEKRSELNLGFVEKALLPKLLALSDVLVQPGRPGPFNDYRLPSKLPEFFASGKPVLLPAANVGLAVVDGQEALLLKTGTPAEIADLCQLVFGQPDLAARLGSGAAQFALRHYNLETLTTQLAHFYSGVKGRPSAHDWKSQTIWSGSEIGILAERLLQSSVDLPTSFRAQLELLGLLVRDLEHALGRSRQEHGVAKTQEQVAYWKQQYDLTKQHLDHVAKAVTLTKNHADFLQVSLDTVRAEAMRLEREKLEIVAQLHTLQIQRRAVEEQLQAHKKQILIQETEIVRLDDLVIEANTRQRDLVYQRDEKIRVMKESFSWRWTAWLRALRRRFLDSKSKDDSPREPLPPVAEHQRSRLAESFGQVSAPESAAPAFRYCLDYPQVWSFRPAKLVLRGWCFAADGSEIAAIRARVAERIYPAVAGLKRLDVVAALRGYPQAEYCGFKIDLEFTSTDTEIFLEAAGPSGVFQLFFHHLVTVKENGGIEELTSYQKWIETFDTLTPADLAAQRATVERWDSHPVVSVLVPVYNTPEKWLRKAVDSVRAQTYSHWELCLADDASPSEHVKPLLGRLAAEDARIKVVYREKNGHISAASNSALEVATGEFIALLDHDDELTPDAVFEMVAAYRKNPEAQLIYSDEDKIDEEGRRLEPYFKPDFLPDLYVGQNYVSHLSVYRTAAVRSVGGFREGYEGSQDWDLALRVIDRTGADKVAHVPKILYHWRAIPGSTALLISEKNYPLEAARRALTDHFARKQQTVVLTVVPGDHWRAKYPLPNPAPRVALIIPTRNRVGLLRRCVESILAKTSYSNFEVIIVDNHSDDAETLGYLEELRKRGLRVLPFPGGFNYSAINNFAVRQTDAEVIGLLNNDLEVIHADWLDEMVSQAMRPEIGCVGAMLYYPNDRIQHAGVIIGMGGVAGHAFRDFARGTPGAFNRARLVQNFSAVTAACLVVRRSLFLQVGGLDEKTLSVAFNDIDFCLKIRAAGYRNLWTPFAELYHHESASRGAEDTPEKHERFRSEVETMLKRWGPEIKHDPAYNPNLTLELNDFSLAAPPRTHFRIE